LAFHEICGILLLRNYQHFSKDLWSTEFVAFFWGGGVQKLKLITIRRYILNEPRTLSHLLPPSVFIPYWETSTPMAAQIYRGQEFFQNPMGYLKILGNNRDRQQFWYRGFTNIGQSGVEFSRPGFVIPSSILIRLHCVFLGLPVIRYERREKYDSSDNKNCENERGT